jgi:SAM-dependent methyltransferase
MHMQPLRHDWCFACQGCGFLSSSLNPNIGDGPFADVIDEERRETALITLRKRNFGQVLDRIDSMTKPLRRSLLEVGSAHGWFLDAAALRGYTVQGIEPDALVGALASSKGHNVTIGFFPGALPSGTRYDVIALNDVFEHLPDPRVALAACRERLQPGGLLVLNLPNSRGTFFRMATLLDRVGISGPYERMWQKGMPSPHLSYFHPDALTRLARREGFAEIYRGTLDSLDRHGLWQRLRLDRRSSLLSASVTWIAISLAGPLLVRLRSDISLQIYNQPSTAERA